MNRKLGLLSAAAFAALLSAGVLKDAWSQASGGGIARWFDGFNNPIGSTGTGSDRAINFNCTNCGGGGGGGGPFPQAVSGTTTSGGIPCFTSTTVLASSGLLNANAITLGGGAGACPKTTPTGANVVAALAAALNATGGIISPIPIAPGDIIYWSGSAWVTLPGNNSGTQFLSENASGAPAWSASAGGGVTSISTSCPATGPATGAVVINNNINPLSKTANYSIVAADCGSALTFTLSSAATANLPSGVSSGFSMASIANLTTSTANLTVTPPSGTIDGAPSLLLPPGSTIGVTFDGTNWNVTNGVGRYWLVFPSVGSFQWVPNPSIVKANLYCKGPGGSGGGGGAQIAGTAAAGAGSGGEAQGKFASYTRAEILNALTSGHINITVSDSAAAGGGGAMTGGTPAPGTSGSAGPSTTIGSSSPSGAALLSCPGGGGGGGSLANSAGGGGGGGFNSGQSAGQNTSTGTSGGAPGGGAGAGAGTGSATIVGSGAGVGGVGSAAAGSAGAGGGYDFCGASGGSGGGVTSAGTASNGGIGGTAAGLWAFSPNGGAGGTAGGDGAPGVDLIQSDGLYAVTGNCPVTGSAGGGGASSTTANGGAGGLGGPGAGGGGGGACTNASACTGGAGGKGGHGVAQIEVINK